MAVVYQLFKLHHHLHHSATGSQNIFYLNGFDS